MSSNKSGADAHGLIMRGGGSAALGLVLRVGARLLFLFLAARLFGAAVFGAYSVALAVVEVGVILGGLGTKRTLFKLLDEDAGARQPIHIVLDAAAAVLTASAAIAAVGMLVLSALPRTGDAAEAETALMILAPMIAGQTLLDLFSAATRWRHRMRYDVIGRSIVEPYAAIVALGACWALGLRESGLLVSYWAGTLAALAYVVWGARRCFGSFLLRSYRFSWGEVRAIMRGNSLATLTDFFNGGFSRCDIYFVALLLGEGAAGVYAMAQQLRTPIRQVRQSFDGLLNPMISKTLAGSTPAATGIATASATRMILVIQLPLTLVLAIIGRPLLEWLGPGFAAGYLAMILLVWAEIVRGAFGVSDLILLYRRASLALAVTATSAVIYFAGGWALVSLWGIEGAALSALAAAVAASIVRRWALGGAVGARAPLMYNAGPLLAAIPALLIAGAILFDAAPGGGLAPYLYALAASLACYGLVLWAWLRLAGQSLRLVNFRT